MKTLLLMRHASAGNPAAGVADFDRPLDPRGREQANEMARRLVESGLRPQKLIASPAARALETAMAVVAALGREPACIERARELYGASENELRERLRALEPALGSVIVVGHNPGISELCSGLTAQPIGAMPPAALAELHLEIDEWSETRAGCGILEALERP